MCAQSFLTTDAYLNVHVFICDNFDQACPKLVVCVAILILKHKFVDMLTIKILGCFLVKKLCSAASSSPLFTICIVVLKG